MPRAQPEPNTAVYGKHNGFEQFEVPNKALRNAGPVISHALAVNG